ncbi:hypothetical protein N136_00414 [Leifsonia aquatica ATCC 14665]|uniref:Uncharacterized protein n=1 Tax=Leifsonia aquatica ATCC 14665 TaxID=1358026 RepID=U2TEU9_LEIAQ|nr:hypothetical protein N136_00414 [Leifsonia aquatica ATCC 14665]
MDHSTSSENARSVVFRHRSGSSPATATPAQRGRSDRSGPFARMLLIEISKG